MTPEMQEYLLSTPPNIRTIMAGRAYYVEGSKIVSLDMTTGEKLWTVDGTFNVGTRRGQTAALYSFGSRFIAYDGITGAVILNVTGLSGMTFYEDPYVYLAANGRLIKWTTEGTSTDFQTRILWNVSDPEPMGISRYSYFTIQNGLWVGMTIRNEDPGQPLTIEAKTILAINTTTGAIQYNIPVSDPANPDTWVYRQGPMSGSGYGLFYTAVIPDQNEGRGFMAFNVATGKLAWISEKTDYPWGNFWAYMPEPCGHTAWFSRLATLEYTP